MLERQVTRPLGYNARLKLTTAKYYTPSGRCIQAIDYTNRNPDGSVGKVPDSLKKEFKTASGRSVYSGGGIEPDIKVAEEEISKLTIALYSKNYLFDYSTQYARDHKAIPPASTFALTDNDFTQFTRWVENKDYSYKTETEIQLDSFKQIATREKYFDAVKADFSNLQAKVSHDKKQDLIKHKDEVMRILENEIISRYYYLHGRIENSLKSDPYILRAVATLEQPVQYKSLLAPKK